ncbi:hypothetical protein DPMN_172734 [Dreissena polymorpha]|uniref:G-protein coupled receptors family 1 profile domain-containing protein n=2 Tax=Dreissena polymorpha TaxID=45954 RepID=A0A9D4E0C6_DREPO|nr:hypothetical protein DPMN_172734 [Dreissena polymorpha]
MGIYIKLARRRNSKKIRRSLSTSDGKRKTSSESEGSLEKMDIITSVSNGNRRKSVMENILSTIRRLSYGHPGSLSSQNNNFHVQTYKSCVINGRSVSIDYASLPYHHGKSSSLYRAPKLPCLAHTSKDEADAAVRDFLLRQDNKALFALAMLVLTFVICWSPFILCKIIFSICPSNLPNWALQLSGWVLACSAALNPFLYGLGSSDFRKITQRFICGKKSITRRGTRLNAYNQVPHSYDMTGIKHCTIYTNRRIINAEPHSHA